MGKTLPPCNLLPCWSQECVAGLERHTGRPRRGWARARHSVVEEVLPQAPTARPAAELVGAWNRWQGDVHESTPVSPAAMTTLALVTDGKLQADFALEDKGKQAVYAVRGIGTTGEPGAWGQEVRAVVAA